MFWSYILLLVIPQDNLPFNISRISVVGAAGQETTIKGNLELDLAVFIKGTVSYISYLHIRL